MRRETCERGYRHVLPTMQEDNRRRRPVLSLLRREAAQCRSGSRAGHTGRQTEAERLDPPDPGRVSADGRVVFHYGRFNGFAWDILQVNYNDPWSLWNPAWLFWIETVLTVAGLYNVIRSVSRRQDAIEVAWGLDGAAARQGKPSRFAVLSFLWHLLAGGIVGIIVPLYDRSVRRYARGIFGVPGSSRKPPDSPNSSIQELSMLRDRVRTSEMLHFVMGAVQIALGCGIAN